MELRLEIKLASVEELAGVAKALSGLQVGEVKPAVTAKDIANRAIGHISKQVATSIVEETTNDEVVGDDGMIEVESKYAAQSSAKETPAPSNKVKAPTAAEKKSQEKADKKAKEDAERADRIARLKESMEANKGIAEQALAKNEPDSSHAVEPVESIVEEIKQLGDKLMGFTGITLEAKQDLTSKIMLKVGVPQGVRPTQLQQPMLGQFRDMYKASVNATVNPVMGGLV
jgi:hypothetical protein